MYVGLKMQVMPLPLTLTVNQQRKTLYQIALNVVNGYFV